MVDKVRRVHVVKDVDVALAPGLVDPAAVEFFACSHWRPSLGSSRDVALSSRPLRVFAARSPLSRPRSRGRRQRPDDPASAGNQGGFDRLGPRGGRGLHKTCRAQFVQSVLGRSRLCAQINPLRVTTNAYNHTHDPGQIGGYLAQVRKDRPEVVLPGAISATDLAGGTSLPVSGPGGHERNDRFESAQMTASRHGKGLIRHWLQRRSSSRSAG